jgi:hypothetical protein
MRRMNKSERIPSIERRPIRLICTDCNDFLTLNSDEFKLHLNKNNGNPEVVCHCGGVMVLLDNTNLKAENISSASLN